MIRQATENDLERLSEIDKQAYGEYGGNVEYFARKLMSFSKGFLVVEEDGNVTGFIILELFEKNGMPEDFQNIKLKERINGKWINIVAFTTATNYRNKEKDTVLLLAGERIAKNLGCTESCVPLTKDHPFKSNGVFEFYEMNGYKAIGEIDWVPAPHEHFECWFLRKKLI